MNLFANFQKSHTTQERSNKEIDESNERSQSFEKWVDEIYQQKTTITQLYLISEQTQFNLPMGQKYTIIIDRLRNACTMHRRLIKESVEVIWKSRYSMIKINEIDYLDIEPLEEGECIIQVKECIVWIIYQHFCSIVESNKQICLLWDILNHNFDGGFTFRLINNNDIQLNEDVLNQYALKELIPTSQQIQLNNFKSILQCLLQSPIVYEKNHLEDLYRIYRKSQINLRPRIKKKTMKISMEIQQNQNQFYKLKQNKIITNQWFSRFGLDYDWFLNDQFSSINQDSKKYHESLYLKQELKLIKKEELSTNTLPTKKKKNKKNKKKKKKKSQQIQDLKKINQDRKNSNQTDPTQQNLSQEKIQPTATSISDISKQQQEKTIKMLQQMIIDDSVRIRCNISESHIQKWFKQIRTEDL